ncbi:MAG TPA: 2,3-bisphosphoglycerate-independent phosphoglycerate mutase, partial [Candidatus Marinimicrobia bacterium]|nr:2,3-bisphosphoglycerate-independent phosphoglycerate mutase [Candidatus Neomarinimicrobiota bacterium]
MVTSQKFDLSNAQDNRKLKFALLIVDGYGLRDNPENNAVLQAKTPYFDKLYVTNPMSELIASGRAVGLPEGVMGNSEVGHMTIGSGRINRHELVRINDAISDGSLGTNSNLIAAFDQTMKNNSRLHLLGLLSDGGVHSHIDHLKSLLLLAREAGVEQV